MKHSTLLTALTIALGAVLLSSGLAFALQGTLYVPDRLVGPSSAPPAPTPTPTIRSDDDAPSATPEVPVAQESAEGKSCRAFAALLKAHSNTLTVADVPGLQKLADQAGDSKFRDLVSIYVIPILTGETPNSPVDVLRGSIKTVLQNCPGYSR